MTTTRSTAFTAAHRVSDGIHGRTANMRTASFMTNPPRLADDNIHVIRIADDADRRPAFRRQPANFP